MYSLASTLENTSESWRGRGKGGGGGGASTVKAFIKVPL